MSKVTTHTWEQARVERGVTMRSRVRALIGVGSIVAAPALLSPTTARAATPAATARRRRAVASGKTWEVAAIARLDELVVEEGVVLTAPRGTACP
ncbi:hypothetical protein R6V09_22855 [Streptomyces sp. W16]|uniref:hypothetical protein n=1 Tax=Streptomyces sp. W16 TaxID=3076631 RepID=UPI00295B5029|nr:hypothetical protein [Streptomyces sp. W16]MDV9172942.1 hypothetical protein [Streptomyces sp. W16]